MATALSLVACAPTTQLTSTWKDAGYTGGPLKKVAVFVFSKDEAMRRFAEDQGVRSMPAGTQAVAGYTLFEQPEQDREKVKAHLVKDGFDGVLVSRLVSLDKGETYVPPTYYRPSPYHNFPLYYGYAYDYMAHGYVLEYTTAVVETHLYVLPTGKLIWSGVSKSFDPSSRAELAQQVAQIVGTELQKEGLVSATLGRR